MGPPRRKVMHTVLIIFLDILTIIAVHGKRENIPIEKAPYQVMVTVSVQNPESLEHGGGVIISKEWIVTAAHICKEPTPERYLIVAGTNVWYRGGSRHTLSRLILHPDWSTLKPNRIYVNDIALLKVAQPFVIDATRQYLHLNKQPASILVGDEGIVSGWPGDERYLSQAYCRVMSTAVCKMYTKVPDGVLCTNLCANNAQLQCGDSGGPFVVNRKLVGIVSQRALCVREDSPIYVLTYTEIYHYVKWIKTYVTLPNKWGRSNIASPSHLDNPNIRVALQLTF